MEGHIYSMASEITPTKSHLKPVNVAGFANPLFDVKYGTGRPGRLSTENIFAMSNHRKLGLNLGGDVRKPFCVARATYNTGQIFAISSTVKLDSPNMIMNYAG